MIAKQAVKSISKEIIMMYAVGGTGWIPSPRDFRDYTLETTKVQDALSANPYFNATNNIPTSIDLSGMCSPIEDQLHTSSCTSQAGAGLLEYFYNRYGGRYTDISRLFLYKVTRNLMGRPIGDNGAYISTTLNVIRKYGVCEERFWPFNPKIVDEEPNAFCYYNATCFQIMYYRLDNTTDPNKNLFQIKHSLTNQRPSIFGFTVYSSIPSIGSGKTDIFFPTQNDSLKGGHAVVAVGYDDQKQIGNHKGALLIRNSWSKNWGIKGYGWLPYAYVEHNLATEFYTFAHVEFENQWII